MNRTVMLVRDYYNSGYQKRKLDTNILTICVDNLSDEDIEYIRKNGEETLYSEDVQYKFFMSKLLSRYEDVIAGRTKVSDEGRIEFTVKSSAMELCDDARMYETCKSCGIRKIEDITGEAVKLLPGSVVGRLMGAALAFKVSE